MRTHSGTWLVVLATLCAPACQRSRDGTSSPAPAEGSSDAPQEARPQDAARPPDEASRASSFAESQEHTPGIPGVLESLTGLPVEPPAIEARPAQLGEVLVTNEARKRAVLALLAGGEPATRLPRAVVDPGQAFDPQRRDRVAPEKWKTIPRPPVPRIRKGTVQLHGNLSFEVIDPIVRQNFVRVRRCYESGLSTNANLQGRIGVKFVIDGSGKVTTAEDGGSDLPDEAVVSCVIRSFDDLSFPRPDGGTATVVYPIIFSPPD